MKKEQEDKQLQGSLHKTALRMISPAYGSSGAIRQQEPHVGCRRGLLGLVAPNY